MLPDDQIRKDILTHYPLWSKVPAQHIKVQKMTGITNLTYKAQVVGHNLEPIIYRRFGESSQNIFLSREEEIHIYQSLSASGDGPKIFYFDQRIRLEEFIESTVLEAKNMLAPGYCEEVAYALAHFHQIKMTSQKVSKQNLIRKTFIQNKQKMLAICQAKLNKDIYTAEEQKEVDLFKSWVSAEEIDVVEQIIKQYQQEPLVFSHNDLLANNVLIRKDSGRFLFIDYQYGTFNFPFYDIANYFEESQLDYDVPEAPFFAIIPQKPSDVEMRVRFIDAYNIAKDFTYEEFKVKFQELRKEPKYIEKRQKLLSEVIVGRMLCSLMWGWWAIIVSKNPLINFDYIKFARMRYDNYQQSKKSLLK